ncbi:Mor transcription activator family protein [Ursidibacter sp. B-7004-1]
MRKSGYNHFVKELKKATEKAIKECHTEEEISERILDIISQECGGFIVYIPVFSSLNRDRIYAQIRKEFNGKNHSELARKYNISLGWIYKIVKGQKNESRNI